VLGLGLALTSLAPLTAGADQIADKRAEAERIARQLDAQGERISVLAERLNQANMKADRVAAQVVAAQAALTQVDHQVQAARNLLRAEAVTAYVQGGRLPTVQALATAQGAQLGIQAAYAKTVAGKEQSALDALHGAREQLADKRAALETAQRSARAAVADVAASKQAAAGAAADEQAVLGKVKGELASLVQAEEQRRAAEAARRAETALAARLGSSDRSSLRSGGPEPPVSNDASGAVEEARRQIGKPYEYGAAGPDGFDCSGLTMWSWGHAGHSLPHSASAQYDATSRVSLGDLQPGDLVFFGSPIHHVGIYVGGGQMIEASHSGTPVRYASISRSDMVGAGRVG